MRVTDSVISPDQLAARYMSIWCAYGNPVDLNRSIPQCSNGASIPASSYDSIVSMSKRKGSIVYRKPELIDVVSLTLSSRLAACMDVSPASTFPPNPLYLRTMRETQQNIEDDFRLHNKIATYMFTPNPRFLKPSKIYTPRATPEDKNISE